MNQPRVKFGPSSNRVAGRPLSIGASSRPPAGPGAPAQRSPAAAHLYASPAPLIEPLALRPADAARALGVSERTLRDWAKDEGLPQVVIGKVVMHPVRELRGWLAERIAPRESPSIDEGDRQSTAAVAGE